MLEPVPISMSCLKESIPRASPFEHGLQSRMPQDRTLRLKAGHYRPTSGHYCLIPRQFRPTIGHDASFLDTPSAPRLPYSTMGRSLDIENEHPHLPPFV
jgi:hypothetical protein